MSYDHASMARVGIIGASGYTGAELMRLCAQHPDLDLVYATGDTQAGTRAAASLYPSLAALYPDLVFEAFDAESGRRVSTSCSSACRTRRAWRWSRSWSGRSAVSSTCRRRTG